MSIEIKISKKPVSEYKHGDFHSLKVDELTMSKMLQDDNEGLLPPNITEALDTVYYYYLDSKLMRKRSLKIQEGNKNEYIR